MRIFGIDCGLDGAIVEIDTHGALVSMIPMPTIALGKGRDYDVEMLIAMFSFIARNDSFVMLEDVGHHAPSASGLRSMTRSFAIIETLIKVNNLRYDTALAIKWQREFFSKPKMPKGQKFDTKAAALNAARRLWSTESFRINGKSGKLLKNPHDGIVDAALIAEFARRNRV